MPVEMMATVEFEARHRTDDEGSKVGDGESSGHWGGAPDTVTVRVGDAVDPGVSDYLEAHLDHLREHWHLEKMLRANFRAMDDGEQRFKALQTCEDPQEFAELAQKFVQQIWDASDGRASNGVVVVLRRSRTSEEGNEQDAEVAVLKLDLHNPAATFTRLPDAELLSVDDALDLPDQLPFPKSVVYPSDDEQDDVMFVAERGMMYMLDAIEAQIFKQQEEGLARLTSLVSGVVARTRRGEGSRPVREAILRDVTEAVRTLEKNKSGDETAKPEFSPQEVLDAVGSLTDDERDRVMAGVMSSAVSCERITSPTGTHTVRERGVGFHFPIESLGEPNGVTQVRSGRGWLTTIYTTKDPRP